MKSKTGKKALLAAAVCAVTSLGGVQASTPEGLVASSVDGASKNVAAFSESGTYIIVFKREPVATYRGGDTRFPAPPRSPSGRVDVRSPLAVAYAESLESDQRAFLQRVAGELGRNVDTRFTYQHAINAVALDLSAAEARRLAADPEVALVEPPRLYELDTDTGPTLIGAPGIWDGTNSPGNTPSFGEGMVVGIIDSGINHDHPSFAETSALPSMFTHTNPFGSGNFIGFCADNPGSVDFVCNDKLIGAYDFVFTEVEGAVMGGTADEEPFPDDTNGHGTHVASTAAGNTVIANFSPAPEVSGVAPRANIIAYDVCFTELPSGRGLCPNASTLAGINQVVADGIVDVANYSISGGGFPWDEANSLAFLNAAAAGVFISASAGNSGPGPATLGHLEPWVTSVAAASHGRIFADATVDAGATTGVGAIEGQGPSLATFSPLTDEIRFDNTNAEGCTAFAGGTFDDGGDGTIALISRGGCGFAAKIDNATAAGARAAIIFNNRPGDPIVMGATAATTIPAVMISQAEGTAIRDEVLLGMTSATLTSQDPAVRTVDPASADIIASFSSRGPNTQGLLKPDVAAPGVSILAAFADGAGLEPMGPEYQFLQGTSMSSPHNAGSAALIRSLRPSWTPMETKSALMLTADPSMMEDDGAGAVNDATPLDMGAGRVDLTNAALSTLVLNELTTNMLNANPSDGGDPKQLNLASIWDDACKQTCTFTRTVRSSADVTVAYNASVNPSTRGPAQQFSGTVTPSSFSLFPGQSQTLTIEIDTSAITVRDQWYFGEILLTGDVGPASELRMPAAIFPQGPRVDATPASLASTQDPNVVVVDSFDVDNNGGSELSFTMNGSIGAPVSYLDQPVFGTSGVFSEFFVGSSTGTAVADDFTIDSEFTVAGLSFRGFQNGADLGDNALGATIFIFEDAGGLPNSNPLDAVTDGLFEMTLPVGDLDLDGDNVSVDFVNLAISLTLQPGTYWVGIMPIFNSDAAGRWVASNGSPASGSEPAIISSFFGGIADWTAYSGVGLTGVATAIEVRQLADCGAPWLSETPGSGMVAIDSSATVDVDIDSSGLSRGVYTAFECIDSDDITMPVELVSVTLTVNNSVPDAVDDEASVVVGGTATTLVSAETSLLANDSDFDMDTLTATLMTAPANGAATVNGDGTFSYTHDGSMATSDSFTYEVCDNAPVPACATATVNISVNTEVVFSDGFETP